MSHSYTKKLLIGFQNSHLTEFLLAKCGSSAILCRTWSSIEIGDELVKLHESPCSES